MGCCRVAFKGDPASGLFIIIITTVVVATLRTAVSEPVTPTGLNVFSMNGVTANLSTNSYGGNDFGGRKIGETCNSDAQCLLHDITTVCVFVKTKFICQCEEDYEEIRRIDYPHVNSYCIPIRDVRYLGEICNYTEQCRDDYVECDPSKNICVCKPGFQLITSKNNVSSCNYKTGKQRLNKKQEIMKAAMVALACFIVAMLGIFLLFIWNRSIQSRRLSQLAGLDSSSNNIFGICDQLAIERLKDKPPTYEDVAKSDQKILGMPPPIYSTNEDESPSTSANRTGPFPPSSSSAKKDAGHHNPAFVSDA